MHYYSTKGTDKSNQDKAINIKRNGNEIETSLWQKNEQVRPLFNRGISNELRESVKKSISSENFPKLDLQKILANPKFIQAALLQAKFGVPANPQKVVQFLRGEDDNKAPAILMAFLQPDSTASANYCKALNIIGENKTTDLLNNKKLVDDILTLRQPRGGEQRGYGNELSEQKKPEYIQAVEDLALSNREISFKTGIYENIKTAVEVLPICFKRHESQQSLHEAHDTLFNRQSIKEISEDLLHCYRQLDTHHSKNVRLWVDHIKGIHKNPDLAATLHKELMGSTEMHSLAMALGTQHPIAVKQYMTGILELAKKHEFNETDVLRILFGEANANNQFSIDKLTNIPKNKNDVSAFSELYIGINNLVQQGYIKGGIFQALYKSKFYEENKTEIDAYIEERRTEVDLPRQSQ